MRTMRWIVGAALAASGFFCQAASATPVRIVLLEPTGIDFSQLSSSVTGKILKAVNCTQAGGCSTYTTYAASDDANGHAQLTVQTLAAQIKSDPAFATPQIIVVSYEDNICNSNCAMNVAWNWIINNRSGSNIKVVNVSAGTPDPNAGVYDCGTNAELSKEQSLNNNGVAIVRSSGPGSYDDRINTEANPGFIFAVTAVRGAGSLLAVAEESNAGDATDFAAVGVDPGDTSQYSTSFSAPVVAAAAAEVFSANPGYSPAQVKNFLREVPGPYVKQRYHAPAPGGEATYTALNFAIKDIILTNVMAVIDGTASLIVPIPTQTSDGTPVASGYDSNTCNSTSTPDPITPNAPSLSVENVGCILGNPAYFITVGTSQVLQDPSFQIQYNVDNEISWWEVHNHRTITVNPGEPFEVDAWVCNGDQCSAVNAEIKTAPTCGAGN